MNFGDMVEIKDISGKTRFSTPINKGAKGKFTLMKEDYIILPFSVQEPVFFKLGDYVDLSGVLDDSLGGLMSKRYEVVDLQAPTFNNSTGGYDYQLRLDAYYWKWKNKIFKYTPEHAGYEASWSLTATLDVQLGVFLRNLKALGYKFNGKDFEFSIDSTVENKAVAMTYDNMNLLDALFSMAGEDKWNCDCWITDNVIHFGRNEYGDSVKLELGVEVSSMTRSESKGTFATRIFAFGSTKNIPENYRPIEEQAVINGVVQKRLMLPADTPYIDVYPDMSEEEAVEDVVVFDEVYPHRVGILSDVKTVDRTLTGEDGEQVGTFKAYQYKDTDLNFKKEYIIEGQELEITFQSGKLNGLKFGAIFEPEGTSTGSQIWEIKANENYGRLLPDDTLFPDNGDEYILTGFNIQLVSDQYTPAAEQELKGKAEKYAEQRKRDDGTYNTTLHSKWVYEDRLKRFYEFGQKVNLINKTFFENGRESRILGWEFNLDIPWDSPTYIIGESMPYSRISDLEEKLETLTYKGQTYTGSGGSGVYVIKTNDMTSPSDSNVFSAKRSLTTLLRKDKSDTMPFLLTLLQGAVFGKDGFAEGLLGFGAKIDENGYGEMRGLKLWESLTVPQLNYNRVDIVIGDKWRSPGAGIIESVTLDTDAEGNTLPSGTATLKLEDGEIGAIDVDDINMGIWHFGDSRDATEDSDDGRGNFSFAGFTTAYWRITEVLDGNKKTFRYTLRPGYTTHPQPQMTFSCRGNFTNVNRQTSVYETRTYTRMLWKQNTWEIGKQNIALQYGDLTNLNIFGMKMEGYSIYLNSVYFTGTITQVKEDGTPVRIANDRTDWTPGGFADYYDRVSYEGGLWLCVAEDGTNTIPSKDDPAWLLQVKSGDSIKSYRRWLSAETPYAYGSIVPFADRVFMAAKDTSRPPYPLLMDHEGNYITVTEDGGKTYHYIIIDYTQSEDWTLLLDISGIKDGEDGASISVRYSSDKANWHDVFQEGDIWMQQKVGTGAWSAPMRIVGESGENGKDAQYQEFQFAVNSSLTEAPVTGWQDAPPAVASGQYLWMRTGIVVPPATEPVNWVAVRIGGEKGEPGKNGNDGTSIKNGGRWRTGKAVEPMTVVAMGGKAFLSKVATSNPPMGVLCDTAGNRLIQRDGSYILTGEINETEYELLVENGADGKNAVTYEYIYRRDSSRPATPAYSQADNYIPSGWTSTSQGVDENNPYEYRSERKKSSEGLWSEWSTPVLVFSFGKQGLQGLSVRDSEWAVGVQYRNDADLKTNVEVRYLDVALVRNDATETGWDAYQCLKTHVSSDGIRYDNTEYWKKFSTNVGAIFTSLIIAKNAKINFLTGNQLTIAHSVTGKPCLGLSGSAEGEKVRFWVGSETPDNAPIKILEDGTTKQGNDNFVLHSDNSGEIANGALSWNSKGEFDFSRLTRSPFTSAQAKITPPLYPGEKTKVNYTLTNLLTKNLYNNYLVNTDNEDWEYELDLPMSTVYSGTTIYIFNTAAYNQNKYLSITGVPTAWGGTYKLYGTMGVMLICIGTADEFYGWQKVSGLL